MKNVPERLLSKLYKICFWADKIQLMDDYVDFATFQCLVEEFISQGTLKNINYYKIDDDSVLAWLYVVPQHEAKFIKITIDVTKKGASFKEIVEKN